MAAAAPKIRCREIEPGDVAAVGALLARGFPNHDRDFWHHALDQLMRHEPPRDFPKFGYLLQTGGVPVGALLLICSTMREGDTVGPRCNLSSLYVEPTYRVYAPLLVSHALRHKEATYLNVTAAPHTWPMIEAQGFSRYSEGIFVSVPALSRSPPGEKPVVFPASLEPTVPFDPFEQDVLRQHAEHGCISLWCVQGGHAYPFVFRPRLAKGIVPCTQLIYCHDIADFARFAGPLGRYLALRGRPIVITDANGPIAGIAGMFFRGSMPKYFRGPQRPRLGDLAYTEYAILGI